MFINKNVNAMHNVVTCIKRICNKAETSIMTCYTIIKSGYERELRNYTTLIGTHTVDTVSMHSVIYKI